MANYSKRVRCCDCGGVFPRSETELLSFGKTVLRLCLATCYGPKARKSEALMAQAAEESAEITKQAAENIKNRAQ